MENLRIADYNGYKVREDGKVFKKRGSGFLAKGTSSNGYFQHGLFYGGKMRTITLHRLLALLFIPNPDNLFCVNHKDCNKKNNNLNNLEWCTTAYNIKHSIINGTRINFTRNNKGEKNPNSKIKENDVRQIRKLYSSGNYTYQQIADNYGVYKTAIHKIINLVSWKDLE